MNMFQKAMHYNKITSWLFLVFGNCTIKLKFMDSYFALGTSKGCNNHKVLVCSIFVT
jgi:hypothetical protein